jgi:hypothetical protein
MQPLSKTHFDTFAILERIETCLTGDGTRRLPCRRPHLSDIRLMTPRESKEGNEGVRYTVVLRYSSNQPMKQRNSPSNLVMQLAHGLF